MNHHSSKSKAIGMIRIAIQRLASRYPYHAKILERFTVQHRSDTQTMAVAANGDGVMLYFNAEFVLGLSIDELIGVLLHEVHHVLFGHILMDLSAFDDLWAFIVAAEVTVNEFVNEPLPGTPITLDQFPDLPSHESTIRRYERLKEVQQRFTLRIPMGNPIVVHRGGNDRIMIDEHELWGPSECNTDKADATLKSILQEAAIGIAPDTIPRELQQILRRQGIGVTPGSGTTTLAGTSRARLNWIRLLRHHLGQAVHRRHDLRRPPRRMPELVGIVPGRSHHSVKPRITAVIDTSGSLTPDLLETISAELGRLARSFRVTVVECDTKIQRTYPFKAITDVRGRGGTDLRPPFQPKLLRKLRTDLIVYFTDGYGPAPTSPPRMPVIWCITPDGKTPATWGRVIHMEEA